MEYRISSAINKMSVIDHHAHNLLPSSIMLNNAATLEKIWSEAQDESALNSVRSNLTSYRAIKELALILGCEPNRKAIQDARMALSPDSLCNLLLKAANIHGILLDDGIRSPAQMMEAHNKFFKVSAKRILRIESAIEDILIEIASNATTLSQESLFNYFKSELIKVLQDPTKDIIAYKTIAAYRTGLKINIPTKNEITLRSELETVIKSIKYSNDPTSYRLVSKIIIDFGVFTTLQQAALNKKPVQFHVGFGDKDLDLIQANPLLIRNLLEYPEFSNVNFVLLHNYPYSREAGYLASVYANVYVDFGLTVPQTSYHGQRNFLREIMELTPIEKILFSTDGHFYPESFYLGVIWSKSALTRILTESVENGELSETEAIEAGRRILFENSNQLYKLEWKQDINVSFDFNIPNSIESEIWHMNKLKSKGVQHVRLMWSDLSNIVRCRVIPLERFFTSIIHKGVGVTNAIMGFPCMFDAVFSGSPVGEIQYVPDLNTLRQLPYHKSHAGALGYMMPRKGSTFSKCPRSMLARILKKFQTDYQLEVKVGFENEFILYTLSPDNKIIPFDETVYSEVASLRGKASVIIDDIVEELQSQGIQVEQYHSESANGQFEIVTKYGNCLHACDDLLFTRQTIHSVAAKHGVKATFIPKLFPNQAGSASHVHMSIYKDGKNVFQSSEDPLTLSILATQILAGILNHLPSLLAITTPSINSFERIKPKCWSGAYTIWGYENREAPLRVASPGGEISNLEYKALDATANPHIALSAILAAAFDGISKELKLPLPVQVDPSELSQDERDKLNIKELPNNMKFGLELFAKDTSLHEYLGIDFCKGYLDVKQGEYLFMSKMEPEERLKILCTRY